MADHAGYLISYVEEFFFLLFVAALVCIFKFDMNPSGIKAVADNLTFIPSYVFRLMYFSIFLYPLLVLLSIVAKKVGLYDDIEDHGFVFLLVFFIYNDIIFPIYALVQHAEAPVAATLAVIGWLIEVAVIVICMYVYIA